ncbi:MAG: DNA methyltransferase [Syntrophaceae bacterium]|nr:DNA methyltransferase [Syntrophaceae bacterium]
MRALELFCGIGGFAAAAAGTNLRIACAIDQSPAALEVYRLNFPGHDAWQLNLENVTLEELQSAEADFWWLSPPCQPYTVRGAGRDAADPRALSFRRILDVMARMGDDGMPRHLALENVEGFARSEMRARLVSLLSARGYSIQECMLCPTELGVPMRRPRYYCMASRGPLEPPTLVVDMPLTPLGVYLNGDGVDGLLLAGDVVERFGKGFRILDPKDPQAYTTCFTSGYGRSLMYAGSYLRCERGVRRFAPEEIARLLHFPDGFRFPDRMTLRKKWHLLGNSLSVAAVRKVLEAFPGLVA